MDNLNHIQNFYLLGIGGIGMSALARYFNAIGKNVCGYDLRSTALTTQLQEEGIAVVFTEEVEALPAEIQKDRNSVIIYTPAVPQEHKQYQYFLAQGYRMEKRAAALGMISRSMFTLAVAGTHGKTTTTAILAHLLKESGAKVTAFLGGISENFNSNLLLAGEEVLVVEADEYDRSFMKLCPNIAAITSMDADHLDIYGGEKELQDTFRAFAELLPKDGKLFMKNGLSLKGTSLGLEDTAEIRAEDVEVKNGAYLFKLRTGEALYEDFSFAMPGKHNLQNAVTALAMAMEYGAPIANLREALASFKGVARRFAYKIRTEEQVLIDDYAHHPSEIAAVHQAVREMHPGKKVLVVFQPHLFSRTKDFAPEFATELGKFDKVVLLDIYPAREEPIEGVTSQWLLEQIPNEKKWLVSKQRLAEEIEEAMAPVVVMLGAGDIGDRIEEVKKRLLGEK